MLEKYNWVEIQEYYDSGKTWRDVIYKYKITNHFLSKAKKLNMFKTRNLSEATTISKTGTKHSDKTKKKISEIRKKYFKENPDKHPWKKNDKFKSIPCENLKKVLSKLNIEFISEYTASDDRHFSIDVFLPLYKIGIEVNGSQHYDKTGNLLPYYFDRHNFLVSIGIKMYEFHYSLFFNEYKIEKLIKSILNDKPIFDFDYQDYLIRKLNKNFKICECGRKIFKASIKCNHCSGLLRRKVVRPDIDIILDDIKKLGYRGAGKKYGVSDNAIRKWVKI